MTPVLRQRGGMGGPGVGTRNSPAGEHSLMHEGGTPPVTIDPRAEYPWRFEPGILWFFRKPHESICCRKYFAIDCG